MTPPFADPGEAAALLIGSWSLAAYTIGDGGDGRSSPFGARPGGLLSYTRDGAMSAHLVALDGRPAEGSPRYVAYFGGFTVDPVGMTVAHHVSAASDEALAGQVLERGYHVAGDRLTLTVVLGGTTHALIWQRAGTGQQ